MITTHPTIYKLDSMGKTRVWFIQSEDDRYRVVAGIKSGKLVENNWTVCQPTNVGRSNERDAVAQCVFEVAAEYEHQLSREYHRTEETIATPNFQEPMLAKKYEGWAKLKAKHAYIQTKLDGLRTICHDDGTFSREGKRFNSLPHIIKALEPLFLENPALIVDGEVYNHRLKDNFNKLVSIVRKQNPTKDQIVETAHLAQYHVYDLPSHPGNFGERNAALREMIERLNNPMIVFVETIRVTSEDEIAEHNARWLDDGYEGTMVRLDAPYEQKRSKNLLKLKKFQDAEFEVVSINEGIGNWAGCAKAVMCRLPDGRVFGAGVKGTQERARELLYEKHKVVTVEFFNLTPDGIPRFGVATKFWGEARDL